MGKLLFYKILTQLIILIGRLRDYLQIKLYFRTDRVCGTELIKEKGQPQMNGIPYAHISCCDCGLEHFFWIEENICFGMPIRPEEYNYRLRFTAVSPVLATEEMLNKMKALKN